MSLRARLAALIVACGLAAVALSACAADPWATPHPTPTPIGTPRAGFLPAVAPAPEATLAPPEGSWAGVHPSPGYRVVLLTSGDDAPTRALVAAVRTWAGEEKADLRTIHAGDDLIGSIVEAMRMAPDLIVSAGNDLVDALATVTASHLDRQFLVVGAEVAEPTENVTAVDWSGASFRGEGLGMSSTYDARSFTPARCGAAIRAGVTAVLTGMTGVVLWID